MHEYNRKHKHAALYRRGHHDHVSTILLLVAFVITVVGAAILEGYLSSP